jgi:hypothetical protein
VSVLNFLGTDGWETSMKYDVSGNKTKVSCGMIITKLILNLDKHM